jgi:hypothetical protein
LSDRLNLSGRYIYGAGDQTFPLNSGQGSQLPAFQTVVPTRVQLAGLNLTQVLAGNLINNTRFSFNRFTQAFSSLDSGFDPASIGLITGATGGLPTIVVSGFEVSARQPTSRAAASSQAYQIVDALVWTRGAHTENRRRLPPPARALLQRPVLPRPHRLQQPRRPFGGRTAPSTTSIARGATRATLTTIPARSCRTIGGSPVA